MKKAFFTPFFISLLLLLASPAYVRARAEMKPSLEIFPGGNHEKEAPRNLKAGGEDLDAAFKKIDDAFMKLLFMLREARKLDKPSAIEAIEKRISGLHATLLRLTEEKARMESAAKEEHHAGAILYKAKFYIEEESGKPTWLAGEDFRIRLGDGDPGYASSLSAPDEVDEVAELPFELKYKFVISSHEYAAEPEDGRIELLVSIEEFFTKRKGA